TPILDDMNYYYNMINTSQPLNESYGYLWWLNGKKSFMVPGLQLKFQGMLFPDAPNDMFTAIGKNAQLLNIVPSQNLIVVRMGEAPSDSEIEAFRLNNEIWKFLNQIINTNVSVSKYDNHSLFTEQDKINGDIKIFTEFDCRIKIFDLLGRLIFSEFSNGEKVIKSSYLPRGIYFFVIEVNNEYHRVYKIFVE
ncbi:MAG: T9SS type A sorting domain-containing protein, partial [candidate division WOR-3 bacterium]